MDTGTLGLISLPCHVRKQKHMAGSVGTHDQTAGRHWFLDSSSYQAFPIVGTEKHTGHEAEIGYVLAATNGKSPKKNFPVCASQNTSLVSRPWILPIIDPCYRFKLHMSWTIRCQWQCTLFYQLCPTPDNRSPFHVPYTYVFHQ